MCPVKPVAQNNSAKASDKPAERNAEQTRTRILQAGFELMYEHGFQGLRIDQVLAKTDLAKGALYHHFPNKKSLGYAVVDEVVRAQMVDWIEQVKRFDDPIEGLCQVATQMCEEFTDAEVALGCPINNLSQEMACLDEGFKDRLSAIYEFKVAGIADAFERAKAMNLVAEDLDSETVACFIISAFQGISGAAKCMQSKDFLLRLIGTLCDYIRSQKLPVAQV